MKTIIQSLPNTASSWFANTVAEVSGMRYQREYLNPVFTRAHYDLLSKEYGSELVDCYKNIMKRPNQRALTIADNTFGKSDFVMTKECQSITKTGIFSSNYNVIVWLRSIENSWPPNRVRVWSFYDHIWHSMKYNGYLVKAETLEDRCIEAIQLCQQILLRDAAENSVPVVWYEDVLKGDSDYLASKLRCFGDATAKRIALQLLIDCNHRQRPTSYA